MSDNASGKLKHPVRYLLKELAPVDPILMCFKLPYIPGYTSKQSGQKEERFDPDSWESWLSFYQTSPMGTPEWSMKGVYPADPNIHI